MHSKIKIFAITLIVTFFIESCQKGSNLIPLKPLALSTRRISIEINNYCPKDGYQIKHLFIDGSFKYSFSESGIAVEIDTDRDGLTDAEEIKANFDFLSPYSFSDNYEDLPRFYMGIRQELYPCQNPKVGTHDGMTLCGHELTQTSATKFDFDGDGIPDYLELKHRLNPRDSSDAIINSSGDNYSYNNYERIQMGLGLIPLNPERLKLAHNFRVDDLGDGCSNIHIDNFLLADIQNLNRLTVFITTENLESSQSLDARFTEILWATPSPLKIDFKELELL